jgi:putative membrane protein
MDAATAVAATQIQPMPMWRLLIDASIFGIVGVVLLIVGYYLWELVTPYNVRKELEDKNVAVAIVVAAFILGMAIVIAASLILIK